MNKCFAKMEGGVGNQLFQLAAAFAYSKEYGKKLYIDAKEWGASQGKSPRVYKDSLFRNFEFLQSDSNIVELQEKRFNYNELPYVEGDVALRGYFQSLKYFQGYKDQFIHLLELPIVNTTFIKQDNIAFHIRKGDYRAYPNVFGDNTNYFKRMFEKFQNQYQINVFTDSPDLVLELFKEYDFNLIKTSSELNDLTLLSKHDNIVCSNSSFSWWGALLGNNKGKIIVPDRWLLDQDCSDVYFDGMTQYEF